MQNLDTAALKRAFQEDGFVVLRGFLSAEEVESFKSRVVGIVERAAKADAASGKDVVYGKFVGVRKNLQQHDDWARDYLHNGPQMPLLEALVDDAIVPATFGCFDKRPGEAQRIDPHFDAVGMADFTGCPGATMWIGLDPATHATGCLYYLRYSHKQQFESKVGLDISAYMDDAVAMEAAPGDAFIHDARTVHWSGVNQTGDHRRAATLFYRSKTSAQLHEAAMRERKAQGVKEAKTYAH